MGSIKKVMLSDTGPTLDLCSAIKDMGELRLVRKKIEGNENVYLRERTAFEAVKDFFGFDKSERRRQEKEISSLINDHLRRHSVGGKHGEALKQAIQNIRTVVEQRHCLLGREIAKEMENYKKSATVRPLADSGFVAFPQKSAISVLVVAPERVAADHAIVRTETALRLPAIRPEVKGAISYFRIFYNHSPKNSQFIPMKAAVTTGLAAGMMTMIPDLKSSDSQENADTVKQIFLQALKGKSGRVILEPLSDSPQGCSDTNLRAMLQAIDESIAASGKNKNRKLNLKVAIAVADENLLRRINTICLELFKQSTQETS